MQTGRSFSSNLSSQAVLPPSRNSDAVTAHRYWLYSQHIRSSAYLQETCQSLC